VVFFSLFLVSVRDHRGLPFPGSGLPEPSYSDSAIEVESPLDDDPWTIAEEQTVCLYASGK
jgi:hypothetical protein